MAVEVGFRLAGGAQPVILVPARVNGAAPAPFVLDTGAAICLLSPSLARRAGVTAASRAAGAGAGGPIEVGLGSAGTIAVGPAVVADVPVAITDELAAIGRAVGTPIAGGLGFGFLRGFRVTIDYGAGVLRFAKPQEAEARAEGPTIPFRLANPARPLVLVPASVNGQGPFQFALDTGASTTVVSRELARAVGIEGRRASAMLGGGGRVASLSGAVDALSVGEASRRNLSVVVGPFLEPLGEMAGVKLDGIVGYNFLREYRVTLDYPGSSVVLEDPA